MKKDAIVINYTGRKGGATIASYEIAKALMEQGEVVIPIISRQIENIEMWEKLGFEKLIELETYTNKMNFVINTLLFNLRNKREILRQTEKYRIKAIYSPMITFWTKNINNLFPSTKIIVGLHDPIPHSGEGMVLRIMKLLCDKKNLNKADEIIVHSQRFVNYVEKKYGKAFYLPLGPHNYDMYQNTEPISKNGSDKINFLFFGRIEAYKGLDILAEAYGNIKNKYQQVTLTVVGNGDFSNYKKKYCELRDVKIINRWVSDEEIKNFFSGENIVCVCPYKDATQSGVVLTAYGFGVPIIATDTGGLGEQVTNGKTGFLIPPNDVNALENVMEKFVEDKDLIKKLQPGIKEYLDNISWDKFAKKLLNLINISDGRRAD